MPTSTKPLRWVASSKKDLMAMPEEVIVKITGVTGAVDLSDFV